MVNIGVGYAIPPDDLEVPLRGVNEPYDTRRRPAEAPAHKQPRDVPIRVGTVWINFKLGIGQYLDNICGGVAYLGTLNDLMFSHMEIVRRNTCHLNFRISRLGKNYIHLVKTEKGQVGLVDPMMRKSDFYPFYFTLCLFSWCVLFYTIFSFIF